MQVAATPERISRMTTTESYTVIETQIEFWTRLHQRLGLGNQGIALGEFLEDPYRFLRLAGTGEIKVDLDLFEILPSKGHA